MTTQDANQPAPQDQPAADQQTVADRLRPVVVRLRPDLEVSRHVFQGEPAYVVRDPITFASHRLEPTDYEILVRLESGLTLGELFEQLADEGILHEEDETDFYNYILGLHRYGLLDLPFSDHKALYQRYAKRQKSKALSKLMSPLFLRVPLVNPDIFLNRTIHLFGWLYTKWAFAGWLILVLTAAGVAFTHRDRLAAPLLTALELENLPLLWILLVGLKIFHELGHAYACKKFGGHVPEIGAIFIAGTPCAYVDATAAWGFPRVLHRLIVNLGGMYFESFFAAAAVLVWAATPPGLVNTAAYQTALLAGIVTIGFNINPLTKFDGYYILTDLSGIPNLRKRATEELTRGFNRVALGLRDGASQFGRFTRCGLMSYGVASSLYRITMVLGISAMIATKTYLLGITVAVAFVLFTLYGMLTKAARYLWFSPTTAPVRVRAVGFSVLAVAAAVLGFVVIPVSRPLDLAGVLAREHESVVFSPVNATVEAPVPTPGGRVHGGDHLLTLTDPELGLALAEARSERRLAEIQLQAATAQNLGDALTHAESLHAADLRVADALRRLDELAVAAPTGGRLLTTEQPIEPGMFVRAGDPLYRIGSGGWVVKVLADAESLADAKPEPGDRIELRSRTGPDTLIRGTITEVARTGSRTVEHETLTHEAGGPIPVTPGSTDAAEPYFAITIDLENAPPTLRHGTTVTARLDADAEPFGAYLARRVLRFAENLSTR